MRYYIYPTLILVSILFVVALPGQVSAQSVGKKEQAQGQIPQSFADQAEELLPSVVNISSTQKIQKKRNMPDMPQFPPGSPFEDFFEEFLNRRGGQGMPAIPPASLGSGFIVDAENGYIATNNHVIRDAEEVRVTLHDDTTLTADIIGRDEKTDIAIVQVDTDKNLRAVSFGNSADLRVGDWILAIGNPFGLGGTVTAGIVSARQRDINAGPYDDFIQTDASINRGNSGGPMFNVNGQVIGINTAIFSPSGGSVGIGFAIPSSLAQPVINQIIEYGRTRRGWLGVRIQTVTEEIAESLGLEKARGALVASVNADGPAEKAGLKSGDVILSFDGNNIEKMRELPRVVAETKIGRTVDVQIWRDGEKITEKVSIGELEKAEDEGLIETQVTENTTAVEEKLEPFGLHTSVINDVLRQEFSIPENVDGIVVTKVENLSQAAEKGLLPGDVIVEINQTQINNPQQAQEVTDQARDSGRSSVLFLLNRQGQVRFSALKFPKDEE